MFWLQILKIASGPGGSRFETFSKTRDFLILLSLSDCSCSSKQKRKLNLFNKMRFQQMCICCCPFTYFLRFTFSLICQRYLGMRCWINRIHCAHISSPLLPYSSYSSHILYLTSKLLSKLPHHIFPAYFQTWFPTELFWKISCFLHPYI